MAIAQCLRVKEEIGLMRLSKEWPERNSPVQLVFVKCINSYHLVERPLHPQLNSVPVSVSLATHQWGQRVDMESTAV